MIEMNIELVGALLTLLCVLLLSIKNVFGWPIGVIASGVYCFVFFNSELYGQVLLQLIFILQSIYGWWIWKKDKIEIVPIRMSQTTLFHKGLWFTLGFITVFIFQEDWSLTTMVRFFDYYILAISLWANYLLSKKVVESWLLWVMVDIMMIVLMVSHELWWSVVLYVILLVNAVNAYVVWNKNLKNEGIE